jgi:hypothetical protein
MDGASTFKNARKPSKPASTQTDRPCMEVLGQAHHGALASRSRTGSAGAPPLARRGPNVIVASGNREREGPHTPAVVPVARRTHQVTAVIARTPTACEPPDIGPRPLPLHDEYFLLAHDDYSGKPRVHPAVLRTGLAGALVGRLVLARRIAIIDNAVTLTDRRPLGDPASDHALDALAYTRPSVLPVRAWVEYMRDDLYPRVGQALIERRIVVLGHGGWRGRSLRYRAGEAVAAAGPRMRLRAAAVARHLPAVQDAQMRVLAGLALATGLESAIADGANRIARGGLRHMAENLPSDLHVVVDAVQDALLAMALATPRRR